MKLAAQLVFLFFGLDVVISQFADDSIRFPEDKPATSDLNRANILPSDCGDGVQTRITNGENALLGEFPWMAVLQYSWPSGAITLNCGGSLINNRYVLTAAHCVTGLVNIKLHAVRLREYNTKTYLDCVDGICADPPVIHTVEETIIHENYNPGSSHNYNDIALLRLKTPVRPSNYAKPICLPKSGTLVSPFIAAGWGLSGTAEAPKDVLQKVDLPLADRSTCKNWYADLRNPADIVDTQICAGGTNGKDICAGDSGGPLMQLNSDSRYEVVGIASFGSNFCGQEGVPSVFTRVIDYMPWIRSKLRP